MWDFLDSFQLGALEGGVSFFGVTPDVKIHAISPSDADFEVIWHG